MTRRTVVTLYLACVVLPSCDQPREASTPTVTLPAPPAPPHQDQPPPTKPSAVSNAQDASVDAGPSVRGFVTLALLTTGARVLLVSGQDRRVVSIFPVRIAIATSQSWTIEATKPGYRPYRRRIDFSDGALEKTFDIELSP